MLGHDYVPLLFNCDDGGQVTFIQKLDMEKKKESETMSAMAKFRTLDKQASSGNSEKGVNTTHQNAITWVLIQLLFKVPVKTKIKFCLMKLTPKMTLDSIGNFIPLNFYKSIFNSSFALVKYHLLGLTPADFTHQGSYLPISLP